MPNCQLTELCMQLEIIMVWGKQAADTFDAYKFNSLDYMFVSLFQISISNILSVLNNIFLK